MASFYIHGGNRLCGEIDIQGSKNAALPILAACLLTREPIKLYNCPKILDVYNMIKILENIGCHVEMTDDYCLIDSSTGVTDTVSPKDACTMRSSFTLLGALLGRFGRAKISMPGGCNIGKRPVDWHLEALKKMNVTFEVGDESIVAKSSGICGNEIIFSYPSVGATQNVILAAVLAHGTTHIYHAAKEPEIIDLCLFLNQMGADIHGMGTSHIIVHGVERLHGTVYSVMADRIVAGTYLGAAAATGGDVVVHGVLEKDVRSTLQILAHMGCGIIIRKKSIRVIAPDVLLPVESIHTQPFPGFPTDMQSQILTCLTKAHGRSLIYEDVFEDRFKIVSQLQKMGADIVLKEGCAIVGGNNNLKGMQVGAVDLRGGAALVIAGLMAEGKTQVTGSDYIERGYQDICADLRLLGADIRKV